MELLEDLKKKMLLYLDSKECLSDEIMKIVEGAFIRLKEVYMQSHCDYEPTIKYLNGNLMTAKSILINKIGKEHKEEILKNVMSIYQMIEKDFEESKLNKEKREANKESDKEDLEEQEQENKKMRIHKENISQIKVNNIKETYDIMSILEDSLKDTQSRQNKILDSRGYNQNAIEEIQYKALSTIRYYINSNEKNINAILEQHDQEIKEQLLELYESFFIEKIRNEKKKRESRHDNNEFRESLDAKISLEEQFEFVMDTLDKQEKQKEEMEKEKNEHTSEKSLPDDIFDL